MSKYQPRQPNPAVTVPQEQKHSLNVPASTYKLLAKWAGARDLSMPRAVKLLLELSEIQISGKRCELSLTGNPCMEPVVGLALEQAMKKILVDWADLEKLVLEERARTARIIREWVLAGRGTGDHPLAVLEMIAQELEKDGT